MKHRQVSFCSGLSLIQLNAESAFLQRVAMTERNPRTELCKCKPTCQTHSDQVTVGNLPGAPVF